MAASLLANETADFYPESMVEHTVHPFLLPFGRALQELLAPSQDYATPQSPRGGRYLHLNMGNALWRDYLAALAPAAVPAHLDTADAWLAAGLGEPLASDFAIGNHWRMLLVGSEGAGMVSHQDILKTASYQLQLAGVKTWHICAPSQSPHLSVDMDMFAPDYARFPGALAASCYLDAARPGDVVFYPADYWHQTLNTPSERASGQVFLRVLQDSLFGGHGSSNLLLPRTDLTQLFPQAAAHWVQQRGGVVRTGARVDSIAHTGKDWALDGERFDAVVWATASTVAAQVFSASADSMPPDLAAALHQWAASAQALQYEAIATVYAYSAQVRLAQPMLALHSSTEHPAQFVFDRGQLGGPAGLLAFVVSASTAERDLVQSRVLTQAKQQLGITVQALQTVVEKRATFACTPALQRPMAKIAPGLVACGDYVAGPYPATLEGAVRSGIQAVQAL